MTGNARARRWAPLLLALALAACATSQPVSFYTLSAESAGRAPPRAGKGLTVGLGPVTLPAYLDRPDIVTREGPNQLRLAEFHRWAEPLVPMVERVMARNLQALLGARDVLPLPSRRDVALDRVVEVDVAQLDADRDGNVVLDARWWVYDGDGAELLASGRSLIEEQGAPPPDYGAIAAAMSRAIAAASQDIAAAIRGGTPVPEPAPKRAARS